jgi:hypothetical protein
MPSWLQVAAWSLALLAASSLTAQLNGVYTCANGNPGNVFDYPDIGDFFTALENQGVSGSVTLDIYDDGGPFASKTSYTLGDGTTLGVAGVGLANPLVIRAAAGERPQVLGGATTGFGVPGSAMAFYNVGYLTIEGLTLTGAPRCGISWDAEGQDFTNVRIAGCRIHGIADGLAIQVWTDLTSGPDALVIENNMIWDCRAISTAWLLKGRIHCVHGLECIVRHNTIIQLDAADRSD